MIYTLITTVFVLALYVMVGVGIVNLSFWVTRKGYISKWFIEFNDGSDKIIQDMRTLTIVLFGWPGALVLILWNLYYYVAETYWLKE